MTTLTPGKPAPSFSANNQDGKTVTLKDFAGKKLVLYFYPKDNTPGCTEEACSLRDNYKALLKQGYAIVGVSPDSEKKAPEFYLPSSISRFDLLADTDHQICEDYGVWGEKSMFGRKYMGVIRTTFVIDEKGIIQEVIAKVDTKNHADQLLA